MFSFNEYTLFSLSYLIGSIPFGIIVTKIAKTEDIRKNGSGNIGATNVTRVAGKKLGATVLLLDMVKGMLVGLLAERYSLYDMKITSICASLAVIGHIFPVWLSFKGGKGVATGFGTALALIPLQAFLALLVWITIFLMTRISSLSAIAAVSMLPFIVFGFKPASEYYLIYSIIISLLIFIKHKQNIIRLLKGEESSFKNKDEQGPK